MCNKEQHGVFWIKNHSSEMEDNKDPKISIIQKFLKILLGEGVESFCSEKDILNFRFFFQDFIL